MTATTTEEEHPPTYEEATGRIMTDNGIMLYIGSNHGKVHLPFMVKPDVPVRATLQYWDAVLQY